MGQAGVSRRCPNCGSANGTNEQFCTNCGYALDSGSISIPRPQSPQSPQNPQNPRGTQSSQSSPNVQSPQNTPGGHRITGELHGGQQLGGRYRIIQLIGKGGFGAVYRASDERFQSKRIVAIKEMSDAQLDATQRAKAISDFRNEAEILVELSHPNLPNVSDFFEEDNKAYLVMELIEGKSLEDEQAAVNGPLPEQTVMGWALQLCTVLHYLHSRPQPIIFRDMKPSNVMLTADGQIKLIDFGIARVFKAAGTKDTSLLGSQGYAPLEQYGRGQSDARSDIYALGATLYDLLTHELPVDAPTRRIDAQAFVTPRQLNPAISPATEQIILTAMADEPADRYQSANEMYQAILSTGLVPNSGGLAPFGTTNSIPTIQASTSGTTMATPPASAGQRQQQRQQVQSQTPYNAPTVSTGGAIGGINAAGGTQAKRPLSRRSFIIGGATVVGVVVIGGTALALSQQPKQQTGPAAATGGTINLNFIYSTEKDAWIQKALQDFKSSNPRVGNKSITVNATSQGSVQTKDAILNGTLTPTAWSPASTLELNELNDAWNSKHGTDITYSTGDYQAKTLVFSPLVFAVWKDRATLLSKAYGKLNWRNINTAINLKSWQDIGGQSNWGQVKLGQTRPDDSNSGLLSITLQAYSYYNTQRGLTVAQVDAKGFQGFFGQLEGAVQQFGRSSGTYLVNEVIARGPAAYDIVPIYENLVLTNQQTAMVRNNQPLLPIYPDLNILSDHPFAILNTPAISAEEKEAARTLRDFLLSDQEQRNALLSGFRPYNPNIQLTDKINGNPFLNQPTDVTIQTTISNQAQPPSGKVVDELLHQWTQQFGSAATALSWSNQGPMDTEGHA